MDGIGATDLIQLLDELIEQHGDDLEVAVAVTVGSRPLRQYIRGVGVDSKIRQPDEPPLGGAPLAWLIVDTPPADLDPYAPRRASMPAVD